MERPVRESRGLGPKALEDGLKEPDPDGSPGTKKVDGLFQDSMSYSRLLCMERSRENGVS